MTIDNQTTGEKNEVLFWTSKANGKTYKSVQKAIKQLDDSGNIKVLDSEDLKIRENYKNALSLLKKLKSKLESGTELNPNYWIKRIEDQLE